jgi:hypothetical protein
MKLIEFQECTVWKNKFINLNLELEKRNFVGDVGCSNNEKKQENLILAEWTSLPSLFSAMKKLTSALLTMLGSTYTCEQFFSSLYFAKSTVRNRFGSDISAACMQLKTTDYKPRHVGQQNAAANLLLSKIIQTSI